MITPATHPRTITAANPPRSLNLIPLFMSGLLRSRRALFFCQHFEVHADRDRADRRAVIEDGNRYLHENRFCADVVLRFVDECLALAAVERQLPLRFVALPEVGR